MNGPPAPLPQATAESGYYGRPLLKPPVWTWEVPAYFFVGGAAGAAALIAEISRIAGDEDAVWRDARWIAGVGGALSAPLLIADLGRPERFLNMLRVFKPQSPMSVGVWIVMGFTNAAAAALVGQLWADRARRQLPARVLSATAGPLAAAAGLGMATYTGVLIGATAVPVWANNVRLLPIHFAFSGLGTATALLQLRHPANRSLHRLGLTASVVETAIGAGIELAGDRADEPLKRGAAGHLMRAAGVLSGPVPLLLRMLGRRSATAQRAAALAAIAGSLLTRYAWIRAGRASALDPSEPLALPQAPLHSSAPGRGSASGLLL